MDMKKSALWLAVIFVPLGLIASGTGWAKADPFLTLPAFSIPTIAVFAIGLILGVALRCGLRPDAENDAELRDIMIRAPLPAILVLAGLFLCGAQLGIPAERAAIGLLLAVIAFVAAIRCIDRLAAGDEIGFESHWGGVGGGSGGGRIFPAAGLAILAIAFAGASLALVVSSAPPPAKTVAQGGGTETAPATKAGASSSGGAAEAPIVAPAAEPAAQPSAAPASGPAARDTAE